MRCAALIAAAAISLTPVAARAEQPSLPDVIPPKARKLAELGRAAHDAGKYDEAIVAFKEAYVIAPSPSLLFNIAQAYRLQGNCDDAAMMYRRYLDTGPSLEGRRIAEGHLTTVGRCAQQRDLHVPVDTSVGQLKVPPPPVQPVLVTRTAERRAELEKNLGIGVTIGGSVAMSVALYYGFVAHNAASEVEDAYAHGAKWKDVADIDARGQRAATIAKVFGVGGGLVVATGVTMYLMGKRADRALPVAVVPTNHGAEVSLAWRF